MAPTLLFNFRGDLSKEFEEVMLHNANHVEAISNDPGIGKVASDDGPIRGAQVNTDQAHSFPAFQRVKKGFEGASTLSFDHIEELVVTEVTEGSGVATALVKGVFVDTKFEGAFEPDAFASFSVGVLVVDAFDGGAAQRSTGSHGGSTDTFVMEFVDMATERFRGMPAGPDAFEWLHEAFRTAQAAVSAAVNEEVRLLTVAFEMSDLTLVSALAVEAAAHWR